MVITVAGNTVEEATAASQQEASGYQLGPFQVAFVYSGFHHLPKNMHIIPVGGCKSPVGV